MSAPDVASPAIPQRRRHQAQGRRQDRAHPYQGRRRRTAQEARLDPRARAVVAALLRDQEDPARAQPAHGVRGSVVSQHRRVLRQGHRDVHDHGRHLHAALPVLRRGPRPPLAARPRRAREPGAHDRRARAQVRRGHQRRPRRPARRRRAAFRRLHPRRARAFAFDAHRGAGARFPRPARARARRSRRGAARRHEPQPRDGAPALQAGAARRRLCEFAHAPVGVQGALPGRSDQVGIDGRARRDRRGDPRRDARHARAPHRHAHHRPVPAADRRTPAGASLRSSGHVRDVRARSGRDGLRARRGRRAGPLVVPRRCAGARRPRSPHV